MIKIPYLKESVVFGENLSFKWWTWTSRVFCWQSGQIHAENLLTRESVRAIPVSSPPRKCGILDPKWQFKSCSIYYKTHLHSPGINSKHTTLGKFPFSLVQKPGRSERNVSRRNSISMLAETIIEADELDSINTTVDGRNPAPVNMVNIPLFTRFYTSQVVQDFSHQH